MSGIQFIRFKTIILTIVLSLWSCTSREEHISTLVSKQVVDWLNTYYNPDPMREWTFSNENLVINGNNIVWEGDVHCSPRWIEGCDTTINERVTILMTYKEDEDRVVMEHQSYNEL